MSVFAWIHLLYFFVACNEVVSDKSPQFCGAEHPTGTIFKEEQTDLYWYDVDWNIENCGDEMGLFELIRKGDENCEDAIQQSETQLLLAGQVHGFRLSFSSPIYRPPKEHCIYEIVINGNIVRSSNVKSWQILFDELIVSAEPGEAKTETSGYPQTDASKAYPGTDANDGGDRGRIYNDESDNEGDVVPAPAGAAVPAPAGAADASASCEVPQQSPDTPVSIQWMSCYFFILINETSPSWPMIGLKGDDYFTQNKHVYEVTFEVINCASSRILFGLQSGGYKSCGYSHQSTVHTFDPNDTGALRLYFTSDVDTPPAEECEYKVFANDDLITSRRVEWNRTPKPTEVPTPKDTVPEHIVQTPAQTDMLTAPTNEVTSAEQEEIPAPSLPIDAPASVQTPSTGTSTANGVTLKPDTSSAAPILVTDPAVPVESGTDSSDKESEVSPTVAVPAIDPPVSVENGTDVPDEESEASPEVASPAVPKPASNPPISAENGTDIPDEQSEASPEVTEQPPSATVLGESDNSLSWVIPLLSLLIIVVVIVFCIVLFMFKTDAGVSFHYYIGFGSLLRLLASPVANTFASLRTCARRWFTSLCNWPVQQPRRSVSHDIQNDGVQNDVAINVNDAINSDDTKSALSVEIPSSDTMNSDDSEHTPSAEMSSSGQSQTSNATQHTSSALSRASPKTDDPHNRNIRSQEFDDSKYSDTSGDKNRSSQDAESDTDAGSDGYQTPKPSRRNESGLRNRSSGDSNDQKVPDVKESEPKEPFDTKGFVSKGFVKQFIREIIRILDEDLDLIGQRHPKLHPKEQ